MYRGMKPLILDSRDPDLNFTCHTLFKKPLKAAGFTAQPQTLNLRGLLPA